MTLLLFKLCFFNAVFLFIFVQMLNLFNESYHVKVYKIIIQKKSFFNGKIEESSFTFQELTGMNSKLKSTFAKIRVNLDNPCNFLKQNAICNFPACGVCQCEDNEIPLPWRQENEFDKVDKKIDDNFFKWVEKYNPSACNNWILDTEINCKDGIYVNLLKNVEALTGYEGKHIWKAIYNENCFADELHHICEEEQVLFKIISGLHTNINIHLSQNSIDTKKMDYDQISFQNLTMLQERVLIPDRLNNLFFLTTFKFEKSIKSYNFTTMNATDDNLLIDNFKTLYSTLREYKDSLEVQDPVVKKLVSYKNIHQIKSRFRNISQIMDCVSCQKCKLHGKLQIYGLATMFKILFNNHETIIHRNEIISFMNLVIKVSRSIDHLVEMKEMIEDSKGRFSRNDREKLIFYIIIFGLISVLFVLNVLYLRTTSGNFELSSVITAEENSFNSKLFGGEKFGKEK